MKYYLKIKYFSNHRRLNERVYKINNEVCKTMKKFIKNIIIWYKEQKELDDRFKYGYEGNMHNAIIKEMDFRYTDETQSKAS